MTTIACADPESFVRGGPNLTFFFCFLVVDGREDRNTTLSGPSSARQRNAIQMAFRWCDIECWLLYMLILFVTLISTIDCLYFNRMSPLKASEYD